MRKTRHLQPIDIGMEGADVDLTAAASTAYGPKQGFVDVRSYFIFTAVINVLSATATVGSFLFRLKVLEKDRSTVLWQQDMVTGISSVTATRHVILFGAGAPCGLISASGAFGGSQEIFKTAQYILPELVVAVQGDNDAAANMHLLMEG